MKKLALVLALLTAAALSAPPGLAQDQHGKLEHQTNFTPAEMTKMWQEFGQDQAWKVVMKEAKGKGFERLHGEKDAWGFKGVYLDAGGTPAEVVLCVFDMEQKDSKEKGTMLWAQKGNERYKAYIVRHKGKKDESGAEEWYVDQNFKIQRAHSWFSCLNAKLVQICGKVCLKSLAPCGVIGVSTEIFYPGVGVAALLGCIATVCGGCAAVVSIACAFSR